jgi:hypothetical protein
MNLSTPGKLYILVITVVAVSFDLGTCLDIKEVAVDSGTLKRSVLQKNYQSLLAGCAQKLSQNRCTSKDMKLFTVVSVLMSVKSVVAHSRGLETLLST